MGKVIHLGDSQTPHIDLFYKNTYILLHQDFLTNLLNPDETDTYSISLLSRFKSEISEILNDMDSDDLPKNKEDEYEYDTYEFTLEFLGELFISKETFLKISFEFTLPILAQSQSEADEELDYILKNKLKQTLNYSKLNNLKAIDPTEQSIVNSISLRKTLFKDIKFSKILNVNLIKNE